MWYGTINGGGTGYTGVFFFFEYLINISVFCGHRLGALWVLKKLVLFHLDIVFSFLVFFFLYFVVLFACVWFFF